MYTRWESETVIIIIIYYYDGGSSGGGNILRYNDSTSLSSVQRYMPWYSRPTTVVTCGHKCFAFSVVRQKQINQYLPLDVYRAYGVPRIVYFNDLRKHTTSIGTYLHRSVWRSIPFIHVDNVK